LERALPKPAYIASLAPKNFDDAKRLVSLVPEKANAIEYRLDLAAGRISTRALLDLDPRCAIVTYRSVREGGEFGGSLDEYRKSVQSAYDAGAVVDVELESGLLEDREFLPDRSRVIGSRHATGEITDAIARRFLDADVAAVKLVQSDTRSVSAAAVCVALTKRFSGRRPFSCFATGKCGSFTRVLGPQFGSALTYGSVEVPTAEGQISLSELFETYGIDRAGRAEKIFAVYGGDVSRSLSPRVHNTLFSRRGLPFQYLALSASDGIASGSILRQDLQAVGSLGVPLCGLSITNPFKSAFESIVEAIDEDDAVARTGASNTLIRSNEADGADRFLARNTDAEAILEILSDRRLAGRQVVILGNGGAARAAAYAAGAAGCEVSLAGRDLTKVKPVAARFGAQAVALCDLPKMQAEVLVNATPVGSLEDDPIPLPRAFFDRRPAVIDFVYLPSGETRLVREAREHGCETADGLEILARQAVGQAKLFGVADATFEEIDSILRRGR
jgi:3-dehydroquinate dehydratase / shikimate dehydrogenase